MIFIISNRYLTFLLINTANLLSNLILSPAYPSLTIHIAQTERIRFLSLVWHSPCQHSHFQSLIYCSSLVCSFYSFRIANPLQISQLQLPAHCPTVESMRCWSILPKQPVSLHTLRDDNVGIIPAPEQKLLSRIHVSAHHGSDRKETLKTAPRSPQRALRRCSLFHPLPQSFPNLWMLPKPVNHSLVCRKPLLALIPGQQPIHTDLKRSRQLLRRFSLHLIFPTFKQTNLWL